MKPLSQTSNGINRAQEKVKRDTPESETAPKEKKPAKMTARPAKKSEHLELRTDMQQVLARQKKASTTNYERTCNRCPYHIAHQSQQAKGKTAGSP